jgi:hypothetical protein
MEGFSEFAVQIPADLQGRVKTRVANLRISEAKAAEEALEQWLETTEDDPRESSDKEVEAAPQPAH